MVTELKRTKYCIGENCIRQLPTRSGKNRSGLCYVCNRREYDRRYFQKKKELFTKDEKGETHG